MHNKNSMEVQIKLWIPVQENWIPVQKKKGKQMSTEPAVPNMKQ